MSQNYRFGSIEIRTAERRVFVEGQAVAVGARAFDLLVTLIDHRDRVVSKDELLTLVWPGLVVEENNLQVQVSTLRKILGNHALATIPGRGYRFTLPVEDESAAITTPASRAKHNLPAALTSFVGREGEIRDISALLATTRLVTLTGMGGTGKTRLSLEVAGAVQDDYPDGVWLVELASLGVARLVPEAVAAVLGVKEQAGHPVTDALEKFVKDRQLLLILDNCEHLLEAAAALAKQLLRAGRGIQVLASSRERLHVMGETAYPLFSLALPNLTPVLAATFDADQLAAFIQNDAVCLFIDRARAAQPGFEVTRANAVAVADICRRLDGIPLAIELAAARVSAMSVEQIAARLEDRFCLFTGADKTAQLRQQTLRASIDWSVDLLSPAERRLFQQLAVFAGGCTLAAAEAVGANDDKSANAVLNDLIQLVEKSLLMMDVSGGRYRMLATVRQYALEQLQQADAENQARSRHLEFYLALAEQARPELSGPDQGSWLARLDLERENMLAAHSYVQAAGMRDGAAIGLRLVWALKPYWITSGQLMLGQQMTLEALAHPGAEERNVARSRGLFEAGQIYFFMGDYGRAQTYLQESRTIAHEIGDKQMQAMALQPLGMAFLGCGDVAAARVHLQDALDLAGEFGSKREISAAMNLLAHLYRVSGEPHSAEKLYRQGLALLRELQEHENVAIILLNISMVLIDRQSGEQVTPLLIEAASIINQIGAKRIGQSVLEVSAGYAASCHEWETAARFFGAAEALALETGLQRDPVDEAFLAPHVARVKAALTDAVFTVAENEGYELGYEQAMCEVHEWLVNIDS